MVIRKRDYIIFYILIVIIWGGSLMGPLKWYHILSFLIIAIFPALILGTITNLLFRKRQLNK